MAGEFDLLNRPGIRFDAGFVSGDEVSTHYDAMLAKVIAWAPTREQAARRLADALARARIHGVVTNRDLLVAVLRTGSSWPATWRPTSSRRPPRPCPSADAAGRRRRGGAGAGRGRRRRAVPCRPASPSAGATSCSQPQVTRFTAAGEEIEVAWLGGRDGVRRRRSRRGRRRDPARWPWRSDGHPDDVRRDRSTGDVVDVDSAHGHVALRRVPRFTDPADAVASGSLLAPMPGTVVSVAVEVGADVVAGQPVLVLEAMKMQHTVSAPYAGVVSEIAGHARRPRWPPGEVLAVVPTKERNSHEQHVHRVRGARRRCARQVTRLAVEVRPRVLHRAGPQRREDHRPVARDRQARLPRRQHPRGVRRRWRRHRRRRGGLRGARRAGLPAADDGRLARRSAAR